MNTTVEPGLYDEQREGKKPVRKEEPDEQQKRLALREDDRDERRER